MLPKPIHKLNLKMGFGIRNETSLARIKRCGSKGFSSRHIEIVRGLVDGKKREAVASEIGISVKTLDHHWQIIKNGLGIHDLANLTKWAIRNGLTTLCLCLMIGCESNGRAPTMIASQVPLALAVPMSAKRVIVAPPVAPPTLWLCWTTEFTCPIQWTVEQKTNLADEWSVAACWYEPGTEGGLLAGSNSLRFQVEAAGGQRFFRVAGNYAPQ